MHITPPRLRPGDLVAVATPSNPVHTPRRLERGVAALRALGWRTVIGPMAGTDDRRVRTAARRADELNTFLRDPEVRAVFVSTGGHTSNSLLDALDWDALRRDPKIIVGYSDITALLLAAVARTGVTTFHGPTLLPELGEFPAPLHYTATQLRRAVGEAAPLGVLQPPAQWTEEFLAWDSDDVRPRTTRRSSGWRWAIPGRGSGPLLGGNLETLGVLAGTRYLPDFTDAVVMWETTCTSLEPVERSLSHLEMLGVFARASGMVVGRTFRADAGFEATLERYVGERFASLGIPVLVGVDIGHADPMLTLPLGVEVALDSTDNRLEVLGAGVG